MLNTQRVSAVIAAAFVLGMAGSLHAQSEIELRRGPIDRLPPVVDMQSSQLYLNVALDTTSAIWPFAAASSENPPETVQPKLSIAELENIARTTNPTLAQAARQIEASCGKYVQEGLYPNPVVGYAGEEIGDEGRAGKQGGFIGQELVTAGKLRLNRAVVSHEIAMARRQWEIQCFRVINDVRASAYDVIAAQRMVELDEQLLRIGQQGLSAAEQLFQAKEVSRVDVLQARIEANSAKLQLENARNNHQAAWQRLAAVAGVPDMQAATLEDTLETNLPEQSWGDSLTRLIGSSPELAQARAQVERAKCFLARQRAERVPNFDLEAGVLYDNTTSGNIASVRMAAPLKIFNRNQGNIRLAEAELAATRQNMRRAELSLQKRLATVFKRYANAKQQVDLYRTQILADARNSLELVQQGYRQGEFGYLELLTSQRTYFRTHLAYVESLQTLWVSNTMIDGLLLSGGLKSPAFR